VNAATDAVVVAVAERLGSRARRAAAVGPLTTYRVGGRAALLVEGVTVAELRVVAEAVRAGVPVLVVGRGSNLLVADAGFPGIAVTLGDDLAQVRIDGTTVTAGGAASLPVVARRTVAAGLTGFEWAVGVPGSIGGAVRMNAGGHGSDMAASLRRVHVLDLHDGEDGWVPADALELGYRRSRLRRDQVVLAAELELAPGTTATGEAELADIVRWRRANQPGGANAGSVFTNPPGDSAGRLIDAVGAKGRRVGSAQVSTKHANFIQVDDGGSADDVVALMAEVRAAVAAGTGVELHAETRMVGFPAETVRSAGGSVDDGSVDGGAGTGS
jgi:UDP-N-acetylmuramate dehydrogenase